MPEVTSQPPSDPIGRALGALRDHAPTISYVITTAATLSMLPKAPRSAAELGATALRDSGSSRTGLLGTLSAKLGVGSLARSGVHRAPNALDRLNGSFNALRERLGVARIGGHDVGASVIAHRKHLYRAYTGVTAYGLATTLEQRKDGEASNLDVALSGAAFAPGAFAAGGKVLRGLANGSRATAAVKAERTAEAVARTTAEASRKTNAIIREATPRADAPLTLEAAASANHSASNALQQVDETLRAAAPVTNAGTRIGAVRAGAEIAPRRLSDALWQTESLTSGAASKAAEAAWLAPAPHLTRLATTAASDLDRAAELAGRGAVAVRRYEKASQGASRTAALAGDIERVAGKASLTGWNAENTKNVVQSQLNPNARGGHSRRSLVNGLLALAIGRSERRMGRVE